MARRIWSQREQAQLLEPWRPDLRVAAASEPHPDLALLLRLFGCAHTSCGRRLPVGHTASVLSYDEQEARLAEPEGWLHQVRFEPVEFAVGGARDYAARLGLGDPHDISYADIMQTPEMIRAVGRHYDSLPEHDEAARPFYEAMRREVGSQFDYLTGTMGVDVESVDYDPYADVHEMIDDLNTNQRLKVLGTHVTGGHPFFSNDENDMFRAVHDVFGHAATGRSFDRHGEEASYRAHARMFTPDALPALASETRGQNASLILNGMFSPQKFAVMDPSHYKISRRRTAAPGYSKTYMPAYEHFAEKFKDIRSSPTAHQVVDSQQFADWFSSLPQDQQEKALGPSIGPIQVLDSFYDSDAYPGMNNLTPYSGKSSDSAPELTEHPSELKLTPWGTLVSELPSAEWVNANASEDDEPWTDLEIQVMDPSGPIMKQWKAFQQANPDSWQQHSQGAESPDAVSLPGKPDWLPHLNQQPTSLDSPKFRQEDRPVYEGTGRKKQLQYFFHPNDWNPASTSWTRPYILWTHEDFDEDEVLPGMPTENKWVKMYRGEPIDLRHPDAAPIRHLLYGDDDSWLRHDYYADQTFAQPRLPGMEYVDSGPWQSPVGEDGEPLYHSPYHNPELGPLLVEHWEKTRGKRHWGQPVTENPNPFMSLEGLGRHWTIDPFVADQFGGYSEHNILPTRFVAEWRGQGEDPYRTNTGGEHPSEREITMMPGSKMKIVDVQVKPPAEYLAPDDDPWVSVWPKDHVEYRYSSARLAAMSDEEYQEHLRMVQQKIEQALAEGMDTSIMYASPDGDGYTLDRAELQNRMLDARWQKYAAHLPRDRRAVLLGGLPASGKTSALDKMVQFPDGSSPKDYLTIDPDEHKRDLIDWGLVPRIEGLSPMEHAPLIHRESVHLAQRLAERAMAEGVNVVFDGTLGNPATGWEHLYDLHEYGYNSPHGMFADIPVDESVQRAQQRHREGLEKYLSGEDAYGGRLVPEAYIRSSTPDGSSYWSRNRINFEEIRPHLQSAEVWDTRDFDNITRIAWRLAARLKHHGYRTAFL